MAGNQSQFVCETSGRFCVILKICTMDYDSTFSRHHCHDFSKYHNPWCTSPFLFLKWYSSTTQQYIVTDCGSCDWKAVTIYHYGKVKQPTMSVTQLKTMTLWLPTLTRDSVRAVHWAISSLIAMSGYRFLAKHASNFWSWLTVKCVRCLLSLWSIPQSSENDWDDFSWSRIKARNIWNWWLENKIWAYRMEKNCNMITKIKAIRSLQLMIDMSWSI